ncbi:MAG: YdeI/OmpD-associated family protein [Myxococcaceae bacterium]
MKNTRKVGVGARSALRDRARGEELSTLSFATPHAWSAWLSANHASSRGVWLKIAKKASSATSITYAEALQGALIWGWIDGQKGKLDESWWLQKFTPRGPKSIWSKINREKAMALIDSGDMRPPGFLAVECAKRDGRWKAAYDSQSRATVPVDLANALAANPHAARFFETLESYNRYAILFRIHTAKKPVTRALRIEKFIAMLSRQEKFHP